MEIEATEKDVLAVFEDLDKDHKKEISRWELAEKVCLKVLARQFKANEAIEECFKNSKIFEPRIYYMRKV